MNNRPTKSNSAKTVAQEYSNTSSPSGGVMLSPHSFYDLLPYRSKYRRNAHHSGNSRTIAKHKTASVTASSKPIQSFQIVLFTTTYLIEVKSHHVICERVTQHTVQWVSDKTIVPVIRCPSPSATVPDINRIRPGHRCRRNVTTG